MGVKITNQEFSSIEYLKRLGIECVNELLEKIVTSDGKIITPQELNAITEFLKVIDQL